MKFVRGYIQAYNDTEEQYQYEKRASGDLADLRRVQDIIETNGMNRMLTADLEGKWIGRPGEEGFKIQYSQKQVSAMARLLKVAQLLTQSKKLNPEGRNYLEEFTAIPDIENMLKQLKGDLKDSNSYMFELREKARSNRESGNIPSYPPTEAEIGADSTKDGKSGQFLEQPMGMSQAQIEEKKKQEEEAKRRKEEEKKQEEKKEKAKETKGKIPDEAIKESRFLKSNSMKTVQQTQDEMRESMEHSRLKFYSTMRKLTEEEQNRLNILSAKYGQHDDKTNQQHHGQGLEM